MVRLPIILPAYPVARSDAMKAKSPDSPQHRLRTLRVELLLFAIAIIPIATVIWWYFRR